MTINEDENRCFDNKLRKYDESGSNLNLDLLTCCPNDVFHILGEVG